MSQTDESTNQEPIFNPEKKAIEKPIEKSEDSFKQAQIDKKSFCLVPTLIKTNTFNAPFPIRLTFEQLTYNFDKNYLKDYLIKDYEGVYCLNQEVIDKQSGIIKEVITQLTKCICFIFIFWVNHQYSIQFVGFFLEYFITFFNPIKTIIHHCPHFNKILFFFFQSFYLFSE